MFRTLLACGAALLLAGPVVAQSSDAAETSVVGATQVVINVNGMVCDFCARAVTKVFGRENAVDAVVVDLDAGTIIVDLKPGEALDDDRIEYLVKASGYALVSIERTSV